MRNIKFISETGLLWQCLGIEEERFEQIEKMLQGHAAAKVGANMLDIITAMNEQEDQLTDAEWTAFMFALGNFEGSRRPRPHQPGV